MTLSLVAIFGALGCVVRWLFEYVVRQRHPRVRPWGTVAANALGCFIAGLVLYRFTGSMNSHLRSDAITGFCGGLTTFSSAFAIPAILAHEGARRTAVALLVATPLLCAGAFALGAAVH